VSNRIVWSGLDEFGAQLKALPIALVDEATPIVVGAADGAKSDMHYPGDLGDRVFVKTIPVGPFGAKAVVTNPHALAIIFEYGTEARHYLTTKGVKHLTGRMPAFHTFVRAVLPRRRAMVDALKALLVKYGLTVSGDA
jgi:hypothetical protein